MSTIINSQIELAHPICYNDSVIKNLINKIWEPSSQVLMYRDH